MHDAGMDLHRIRHALDLALTETRPPALAVAFSGGLDSSVLLDALAGLPKARALGLRALHVDHGLHPDSPEWARRCTDFCAARQVPLETLACSVSTTAGHGLEAAAREARYAALADALRPDEWLATAQHQDDQAETLLLRLLRASGTQALASMRPLRPLGHGTLWRPLLGEPRAALRAYADCSGLAWIEDPANNDPRHDRSWLRAEILPRLRQRWPHAAAALAASAALLGEDGDLLDVAIARALAGVRGLDPSTLRIEALLRLAPALRRHVLRRWLREQGADPLPAHLHDRIGAELLAAADDAQPRLRWASSCLERFRDVLHLAVGVRPVPTRWSLPWDGSQPLPLPTGDRLLFRPGWTVKPMTVTDRRGGERIQLPGRGHRHRLKQALQALGVPGWERRRLPLLWHDDGELLAAGDLLISARLDADLRQAGGGLVWERRGN